MKSKPINVSALGVPEVVPIKQIVPAPDNPRKISDKAVSIVAKSLQRFGWQQPIVVDAGYMVIAGHTRLLAALSLGLLEVPVCVADKLTAREVKAYRIADNRTGDFTSWDFPELVVQLDNLATDFGEVLALADWEAVITEFHGIADKPVPTLDLDDNVGDYIGNTFTLTVICETKEAARSAAIKIIEMDGVTDVREKKQ